MSFQNTAGLKRVAGPLVVDNKSYSCKRQRLHNLQSMMIPSLDAADAMAIVEGHRDGENATCIVIKSQWLRRFWLMVHARILSTPQLSTLLPKCHILTQLTLPWIALCRDAFGFGQQSEVWLNLNIVLRAVHYERILQHSVGENCVTLMFATIHLHAQTVTVRMLFRATAVYLKARGGLQPGDTAKVA